ncbi:hypothetical protein GCM10023184_35970 [Flaviaesturariibacter amylovorans]|uniref:BIG2 domain-containing protein n=2 Tax=Flaviaesturariibacter amylovorans TaxID=1084520 RepID=A0ABP8HGM7_9BACT
MCALLASGLWGAAQQLIVNEVSQGPSGNGPNGTERAYAELLVVGTRTCTDSTLDLRGWILDDNNGWVKSGAGTGIAPGALRFANVAAWQKVPYGSIILVYNDNDKNSSITLPNDPTDANRDYVYVVPASSSLMERHLTVPSPPSITPAGYSNTGWAQGTPADAWSTAALRNDGDAILTVNPAAPNVAAFSFAYGDLGPGATATVIVPDMLGGKNYFLTDANYTQAASWQQGDVGVNETPGAPNGGANTTWINSMRVQVPGASVGPISGNPTPCVGTNTQLTNATPGGTWTSSNPAVATVNATTGMVTLWTPGTAVITYTVTSGGCSASATFTITSTLVSPPGTISGGPGVCVGQQTPFTVSFPIPVTGGTWNIVDPSIATVNPVTGVVTGVAPGTTTLIYTAPGPIVCGYFASTPIVVSATPAIGLITGANICLMPGQTMILSNSAPGGTWTSSDPGIATVDAAAGVVNGNNFGSTTITYTVTNGTCTRSVTRVVHVGMPGGTVTGGPGVCVGATTTYTSNAQSGGTWSSSNPAIATVNPSTGVVSGVAVGTANIIYTFGTGPCAGTAQAPVTVTAGGNAGTVTGGPGVCTGATVTFSSNGTPGGTWSSGNPAIATVNPATGVVTGVAAGSATITYTVGTGACAVTASAPVTVEQTPVVAPITGGNTLCFNTNLMLQSATPGGTWTTSNPAVANFVGTPNNIATIAGLSPGTSVITYRVVNGNCTAEQSITVTVNPLPVASPLIAGPSAVCIGNSITLSGTPPGGSWSVTNGSFATITQAGVLTGVAVGTVAVQYRITENGCSVGVNHFVNVNAPPVLQPTTGTNLVCVGGTVTLTNPAVNGSGTWSSSNPALTTLVPSIVLGGPSTVLVTALGPGTVTINFTVTQNGCSTTVPFQLTINPSPAVAPITGNNTVCLGATTPFASATPGGTWSSSNPAIAPISASGVITGVAVGTADITYTVTSGGCTGTATKSISVSPLPVLNPNTGNPNVCVGSSTTLLNSSGVGVSTWTSSNPAVATVVGGVVTGVSAGTATITYSVLSAEGCTASVSTIVTVTAAGALGPILGGGPLCSGATTTLTHGTPGGTWSSSNTAVATVSATGVVTGIATGTATITYTIAANPCAGTATTSINVQSTPAPAAITGNTSLCIGGTTTLASATPGGTWSSQNAAIATVNPTTGVVTGIATGITQITYTVTTNGCTGVTNVNLSVGTTIDPITGNTSLCVGGTSALAITNPGGTWTSSNTGVATISATGVVTALSAGTTTITYTINNGGCIGTRTATVTVASCVRDVFVPNYFTPNNDGRNDVLYIYGTVIQSLDFRIFNQWGGQVFATTDKGRGWDGTASGKAQPVGVYMYAAQVTLTNGEKITLKGSINLIR